MKNTLITLGVLIAILLGIYFVVSLTNKNEDIGANENGMMVPDSQSEENGGDMMVNEEDKETTVIGTSVEGRDITSYNFGSGEKHVLLVGGIHGGYSWNTARVAYDIVDYLKANPDVVPAGVRVSVVPVLNPDGLYKVAGTAGPEFTSADIASSVATQESGRFNGNTVDLNRNFDCDWQAQAKWQTKTVSGGTAAFSEPESQAIKAYIEKISPVAVVVWYSAAGGVFASSCHNGVLEETTALTNVYAGASGYKAYQSFDFYAVTGDMVNWLAKSGIPAISVLLTDHKNTELEKNKKGVAALLQHYAQ